MANLERSFEHARKARLHYGSIPMQAGQVVNVRGDRYVVLEADVNATLARADLWDRARHADHVLACYTLRRIRGDARYTAYQSVDGYLTVPRRIKV